MNKKFFRTGKNYRNSQVIGFDRYLFRQVSLYNKCNGGYDKFVTAGTISFNGVFTLTRKTERIDGMKMSITFCVYFVFK